MVPAVRDPHLKTHTNIQSAGKIPRSGSGVTGVDDKSPPSSPLTATSSPLSEPPDDGEYKNGDGGRSAGSRARRNARTGSQDRQAGRFRATKISISVSLLSLKRHRRKQRAMGAK